MAKIHQVCCFKGRSLVLQKSNVVSIVMKYDGVAYNIVQHTFKLINKKCFVQVFSKIFVYLTGDQGWMERALHTDSTLYFTRFKIQDLLFVTRIVIQV